MQIKCSACGRAINIPDEKLPKDKAFNITCPGCKEKVRVDQHLKAAPPAAAAQKPPVPKEAPEPPEQPSALSITEDFEEDEEDLVIYGENDQLALILDDKNKDAWTQALEERGYKIQYAKSAEHAVHKMKFTQFHFVALNENFGDVTLGKSPIYQSIIETPMVLRRNIFVALMGPKFKTLNNMEAFANSVNVVINENDIGKLADILKKSVSENDIFYKVFKETLQTSGKA